MMARTGDVDQTNNSILNIVVDPCYKCFPLFNSRISNIFLFSLTAMTNTVSPAVLDKLVAAVKAAEAGDLKLAKLLRAHRLILKLKKLDTIKHVEVKFTVENSSDVLETLKPHQDLDDWMLSCNAFIRLEEGEQVVTLRITVDAAWYKLNISAQKPDEYNSRNVQDFLINLRSLTGRATPFPKLHGGVLGKSPFLEKMKVKTQNQDALMESGLIKPDSSLTQVSFRHSDEVELFCEIHNNTEGKKDLLHKVDRNARLRTTIFSLNLTIDGEYGLIIFVKKKDDYNRVYHVYTYLIQYDTSYSDGTGTTSANSNNNASQHEEEDEEKVPIEEISTPLEEIDVSFPSGKYLLLAELQMIATEDKEGELIPDKSELISTSDGLEEIFILQLPELGQFKVDVFELHDNGSLLLAKTFQITKRSKTEEEIELDRQAAVSHRTHVYYSDSIKRSFGN